MTVSNRKIQIIAVFLVTFLFQVVAAAVVPVQVQHQGDGHAMSDISAHPGHDSAHADHGPSPECGKTECVPQSGCVLHSVIALGDDHPGVGFESRTFFEGKETLAPPSRRTAPLLRPPISA